MRAAPDEVLHFSEDPHIASFAPHVAATARQPQAYVWAVDADRCPDYWFPRQCPRAMAWSAPETTAADRERLLGPGVDRVHVVEYGWVERIRTVRLYAYRLEAAIFRPFGEPPHAMVSTQPVVPLGPAVAVGDLFALHEAAGIELRVVPGLAGLDWWQAVVASTLAFSGIRLRNAGPARPRG